MPALLNLGPSRVKSDLRNGRRRIVIGVAAIVLIGAILVTALYQMQNTSRVSSTGTSTGSSTGTSTGMSTGTSGAPDPRLAYLTILPGYAVLGSRNATVTIFQFGDFQCPTCDNWFKTQEPQVLQNLVDTGKADFVWRDFDYYGIDSTNASQAAYAAGEQGKFWQFYDLLYTNQAGINSGWADKANLFGFAQSLGLNMTEFGSSFNSGKYLSMVTTNFDDGQKLGITGTPTFFVVGPHGQVVEIVGSQPYSVFQIEVNTMLNG